jgi:hypothetical protein
MPLTCWRLTARTCEGFHCMRKTNLARLLARRPDGIFVAPFEHGEIGPDLYRAAAAWALKGSSLSAGMAVPERKVKALGQSEEPSASRYGAGDGFVQMNRSAAVLSSLAN